MEASTFAEIPDSLIDEETRKMMMELEENLSRQGLNITDYLSRLKKSEAELRLDFTNDAIKRVKTGLLIRKIAEQEKIEASHDEIHEEIDLTNSNKTCIHTTRIIISATLSETEKQSKRSNNPLSKNKQKWLERAIFDIINRKD